MDQLNPQIPQRANQMSVPMYAGNPQMMMPGSVRNTPYFPMNAIMSGYAEQTEKRKEFARGVYVTGFEKTLTPAMLEEHFKVKPIQGLKLPMSKYNENKGFAFIYYGSEDDASFVKRKLDHSVILRSKIRVTRTVISQNLSKMMFKLKVENLSEGEVEDIEKRYFNEETLEKEVQKIIQQVFTNSIEVNKIVIPYTKKDKKPLKYARVFFYVSNLKEAFNIVRASSPEGADKGADKNQYEVVLAYITALLNQNDTFRRNVTAEIYEYTKKNQSNVLHLKGIKHMHNEDGIKLANEIRQFIQDMNRQANITSCFAKTHDRFGAWANVTFSTYEETVLAYEQLKNNRCQFRGIPVYASLRNVKDTRTVVISTVKDEVTERQMENFLKRLAESSNRVDTGEDQQPKGRKYDFFSFNILNKKTFYLDNSSEQVGITQDEKPDESWREMNTVPKRVVVHFINEVNEEQIKELVNDIKAMGDWESIFFHQERKQPLRANHQKGHIKNNKYVKHTDLKSKKKKTGVIVKEKKRQMTNFQKKNNPTDYAQFHLLGRGGPSGVPRTNPMMGNKPKTQSGNIPQMGQISRNKMPGNYGQPHMGQSGMGQPPTGQSGMGQPPMGQSGMGQPPMGQSGMGQPPMGQSGMGQPPMGQSPMGQPAMGQGMNLPKSQFSVPPQMGQMAPPMGQQPGQMGQMPLPMSQSGQMPMMGQMPPPMGQQVPQTKITFQQPPEKKE